MYKIDSNEKRLIINADDFGYCNERDQAIIHLLENKKIISVTCLVNGSSFEENIHKLKMFDSIGIHLNLTEGKCISNSTTL